MNPYIVLYEMYTESLNENYIFCVKSNIQVDNKSEQNTLLCCLVFNVVSDSHTHTHAGAQTGRMVFDWMVALVKSQRKDVSRSLRVCVWERLAGLHRWNVWFSGSVRGESGWDLKWNQSCITATEVLSQYYSSSSSRGGGSVAPKVQFYQYLLKDVTFNFPVLEGYCLFEFCFYLFYYYFSLPLDSLFCRWLFMQKFVTYF